MMLMFWYRMSFCNNIKTKSHMLYVWKRLGKCRNIYSDLHQTGRFQGSCSGIAVEVGGSRIDALSCGKLTMLVNGVMMKQQSRGAAGVSGG